jgi:hypothetical protein
MLSTGHVTFIDLFLSDELYHLQISLRNFMINIEEELKILENSVRDIITFVLTKHFGQNWIDSIKISPDRISKWKVRQSDEEARLKGNVLEARLIYYSDFYDLKNIIDKHWDDGFVEVFQDKKTVKLFLEEAEKLRDPNAHRRELFEYQKHLIKGISGELRTRIMKYRGKKVNPDDFFPVVEAVTDSLGNSISNSVYAQIIQSCKVLKIGDTVEIIAYSTDPLGGAVEYSISRISERSWTKNNKVTITFERADIGRSCDIQIMVRSERDFHAYGEFDDYVAIRYIVLPE